MNHFERIRGALEGAGLDAVLLTERANRYYAAGFDSTGTDGAALITRDGAYYWTDSRYIEAASERVTDAKVALTDRAHPYTRLIGETLRRHGVKKLGIDDAYMTVRDWNMYSDKLSCVLLPASELLSGLRAVKDAEECGLLIAAQRIAERALTEVLNDIRPGVTEKFIAARLTFLMLSYGAGNVSFDPIVISGPKTSMPHGVPSEEKIVSGEFVTMDFGSLYHGYCSDMTRTVAVGSVTDEMAEVYGVVLRAQEAGIAAAKAGVTGAAVDGAARAVIEEAGYGPYFGHSFGHGVGVEIHEAPNASPANDKPLPAGAVISAEPGIYLPGKFGVRIEDVLILEENGNTDIALADKTLTVL